LLSALFSVLFIVSKEGQLAPPLTSVGKDRIICHTPLNVIA